GAAADHRGRLGGRRDRRHAADRGPRRGRVAARAAAVGDARRPAADHAAPAAGDEAEFPAAGRADLTRSPPTSVILTGYGCYGDRNQSRSRGTARRDRDNSIKSARRRGVAGAAPTPSVPGHSSISAVASAAQSSTATMSREHRPANMTMMGNRSGNGPPWTAYSSNCARLRSVSARAQARAAAAALAGPDAEQPGPPAVRSTAR